MAAMKQRSLFRFRAFIDLFFTSGFASICFLEIKDGRWSGAILGLVFMAGFALDCWQTTKRLKILI